MSSQSEKVSFEAYVAAAKKFKAGEIKEEEFADTRDPFVEEHGEIINQYMCSGSHTAAMLTQCKDGNFLTAQRTSFYTQYNLGKHPEIEKLLIEIDFLAAEATRTLKGKRLARCLAIIYKVAKNAMGVLDSMYHNEVAKVADDPNINETVKVIRSNLRRASKYLERASKFSTQKNYLWGNIMGFAALALIFGYTRIFSNVEVTSVSEFSMSCLIYYGSIGGGIGALISVMNRLSSGSLNLSTEPDIKTTRILGVVRPLIGGVFGMLVLILFNSGFSVFTLSAVSITKVRSNFLILSFIAGFFERFVPDLLDKTQNKILSDDESLLAGNPATAS